MSPLLKFILLPIKLTFYLPLILKAGFMVGVDIPYPDQDQVERVSRSGVNIATIGSLLPGLDVFGRDTVYLYDRALPALGRYGIETIVMLHGKREFYPDFCREMAERYDQKYFQIWNEPDIPDEVPHYYGGWGRDPVGFAQFYTDCAIEIKKIRTDATLLISYSGDLDWLQAFVDAGGIEYVDVVAAHHYIWCGSDLDIELEHMKGRLETTQDITGKTVWLTETNLLCSASNPEYEANKAQWVSMLDEVIEEYGVVLVYSWKSGWNNADIEDLPAESALRNLAQDYNQ